MAKPIRLLLALLCIALLFLSPSLSAAADFSPIPVEAAESVIRTAEPAPQSLGDVWFSAAD